jgi:hypothetical protein
VPSQGRARLTERRWSAAFAGAAVVALLAVATARGATERFLASLRIAKPQAVTATASGTGGGSGSRPLPSILGGMLAKSVNVALAEPDQPSVAAAEAAKLVGFAPQVVRAQVTPPIMTVLGAQAIDMAVDVKQLRTIYAEAGKKSIRLPDAVDGSRVALRTPRAIRIQYGKCPAPVTNTLQNQIQGTPPPSSDNASCVALVEGRAVAADVPPGLDMAPLMEIALEVSGMSPVEATTLLHRLGSMSTLAVAFPRNLRSFEIQDVNGAPAMLLISAGRRGPTWELVWAKDGVVYALSGYGNAGDALPLARSVS